MRSLLCLTLLVFNVARAADEVIEYKSEAPNAPICRKKASASENEIFKACRAKQKYEEEKYAKDLPAQEARKKAEEMRAEQEKKDAVARAAQEKIDARNAEKERIQQAREEQLRLKEEALLKANQEKSKRIGTLATTYVKYFGEPTRQEIVSGKYVYYYDDSAEPLIVEFDQNNKLISRYIDKDTLRQRAADEEYEQAKRNLAELQRQQQEEQERRDEAEQRAQKWRAVGTMMKAYGDGLKSPPQTNCTSTPTYGGGFTTNCR